MVAPVCNSSRPDARHRPSEHPYRTREEVVSTSCGVRSKREAAPAPCTAPQLPHGCPQRDCRVSRRYPQSSPQDQRGRAKDTSDLHGTLGWGPEDYNRVVLYTVDLSQRPARDVAAASADGPDAPPTRRRPSSKDKGRRYDKRYPRGACCAGCQSQQCASRGWRSISHPREKEVTAWQRGTEGRPARRRRRRQARRSPTPGRRRPRRRRRRARSPRRRRGSRPPWDRTTGSRRSSTARGTAGIAGDLRARGARGAEGAPLLTQRRQCRRYWGRCVTRLPLRRPLRHKRPRATRR